MNVVEHRRGIFAIRNYPRRFILLRKVFMGGICAFNRGLRRNSKASKQSGQELVEFAVVLSFILLVLIGVIDLGRVFHASITIASASRTGARYAISYGYDDIGGVVTVDAATTGTRAQNEAQNSGITLDSVNVNCPGGCVHGGPVVVTVTHNFQFLFNAFIGSGLTLSHSSEMKIPW
jgi:Flp pilus assembly protein TadG